MRLSKVSYEPILWIAPSESELLALIELARTHYDARCNQAAETGGFLSTMLSRLRDNPDLLTPVTWDQLDSMVKISEGGDFTNPASRELARMLHESLTAIRAEAVRVAPPRYTATSP